MWVGRVHVVHWRGACSAWARCISIKRESNSIDSGGRGRQHAGSDGVREQVGSANTRVSDGRFRVELENGIAGKRANVD